MKVADLEPGSIYEGKTGQRRELMAVDHGWATYRMLERGVRPMPKCLEVGQIGSVEANHFAQWAFKDVTE